MTRGTSAHLADGKDTLPTMRYLSLLLLFASGCSSPSHHSYSQAAPGPGFPAPPMTPVGRGAPVVGQPGHQAPEYPRSPHRRVLPPANEPGLWAADVPRAARAGGYSPTVLDIPIPLASDASLEDMLPTTECAAGMDRAARRVVAKDALSRMALTVRQCLAARLVHRCTSSFMQSLEAGRMDGHYDAEVFRRWRAANATAEAFKSASCEGVPVDPALEKSIIHAWQADLWRGDE